MKRPVWILNLLAGLALLAGMIVLLTLAGCSEPTTAPIELRDHLACAQWEQRDGRMFCLRWE